MNTSELNWKDIKVDKSRDRENFDNLVEGKLPQYREANLQSLRGKNPYIKGVYSFNKYQEDTSIKDHHLDVDKYLNTLNFVDPEDFNEDDLLNESGPHDLSNEDKMRLWMEGKRGFNYQAASDAKLINNYKICKKLKFTKGIILLFGELKERGLLDKVANC